MAQQYARDPNAAGILTRLRSLSNVTPTGDAFVDKRRLQIQTGEDELAPSELEQRQTQMQMGGEVSREMIRDHGIQALKQKLGMIAAESQAKLQPEIIKGEYGVRQAREAATAAEARRGANEQAAEARQERSLNSALQRAQLSQGGQDTRQEDRQAFELENPNATATAVPAQLYTEVSKARQGYESMANNPVSRFLFGSGRNAAYETSLTNVLDRKGTLAEVQEVIPVLQRVQGATIDEKIANSGLPGLQSLDPYERQYLQLKLGQ